MNTSIAEKPSAERSTSFFSGLIPVGALARALYWASLAPALLLLTVGVAFLAPSSMTTTIPFVALGGALACWKFRTKGLIAAYVALTGLLLVHYKQIPLDDRLWQMGIIFALALDFFVALLAVEEIEEHIEKTCAQTHETQSQLHQAELSHTQASQHWNEERHSLEQEIHELKQEAEVRRLERQQVQKRFELVESEIQMLTSQKNQFIEDARSARAALAEFQTQYEKLASDKLPLVLDNTELEALQAEVTSKENALAAEVERRSQQQATLKELETTLASVCSERDAWQKQVEELKAQLEAVPEPKAAVVDTPALVDETVMEWKRAKAQAEGLYLQLREQFAQKSAQLSETRKELFGVKEELEAQKHTEQMASFDAPPEQIGRLESTIISLSDQIQDLEDEVFVLEELVSTLINA